MIITQTNLMIINNKSNRKEIKNQILAYAIDLKKLIVDNDDKIETKLNKTIEEIQTKINNNSNGLLLNDIKNYTNIIKELIGRVYTSVHQEYQESIYDLLKCIILLAEHENKKPIFGLKNTNSITSLIKGLKPTNTERINPTEFAMLTKEFSYIFPQGTTNTDYQHNPTESNNYTNSTFGGVNIVTYRAQKLREYPKDYNAKSIPIHSDFTINPTYAYTMFIDRKNLFHDSLNRQYGPKMFDNKKDDCSHKSYVIASYQAFNQLLEVKELNFDALVMANKTALGENLHELAINRGALNPSVNYIFMEDEFYMNKTPQYLYKKQRENGYHNYYDKQYLLNPKCKDDEYSTNLEKFKARISNNLYNQQCPNKDDMDVIKRNINRNTILKKTYPLDDTKYIPEQKLNEEQTETIDKIFSDKSFYKEVLLNERDHFLPRHHIRSQYESKTEIETYFNKYLSLFKQNIKDSGDNKKQKIAAILLFISQVECSHFFTNGNNRVCCQMLLNKLLIDHELIPSILCIPNGISHYVLSLIYIQMKKLSNLKDIPHINDLSQYLALPIDLVIEGQKFFSQIVTRKKSLN